MSLLNKQIAKLLRDLANKFEADSSEASDAEMLEIFSLLMHRTISKEQACIHINASRSKFDKLVRLGKLPRGRKRVGHKELVWWQDELDAATKKMNKE